MSGWLDRAFEPDLVSIVIPTWNRARTLPETLDSVLAQSHRRLEAIVVDEGSTDGTLSVLPAYEKRFRATGQTLKILHQPRAGPAAARNRGLRAARGEFLSFLDSDDLLWSEKLRLQVAFLRRYPLSDAVHGFSELFRDEDGATVTDIHGTYDPEDPLAFLLQKIRTLNHHSTFLWRREIIDRLGPMDEMLAQREDWLYLVRFLAMLPETGCIRKVLCRIRAHEGSLSGRRDPSYYEAIAVSLERAYRLLIENGLDRYVPLLADLAFLDVVNLLKAGQPAASGRVCAVLSDMRRRESLPHSIRLAVGSDGLPSPRTVVMGWLLRRRRYRAHLAALAGENSIEDVERALLPTARPDPAVLESLASRQLVFTVTTGQTGTASLARALDLLPGVRAVHKPSPGFEEVMRPAQSDPRLAVRFLENWKFPAIAREPGHAYVETSHLFCKGFLEPALDMGIVPDLIILERHPRDVASSYYLLGAVPARTQSGRKLLLSPEDAGVLPLPGWKRLHDYQLCYWYCLETARRADAYETSVKGRGGGTVRARFSEIRTYRGFLLLVEGLDLPRPTFPISFWLRLRLRTEANRRRSMEVARGLPEDREGLEREVHSRVEGFLEMCSG